MYFSLTLHLVHFPIGRRLAHFKDGVEAEATPKHLVASFSAANSFRSSTYCLGKVSMVLASRASVPLGLDDDLHREEFRTMWEPGKIFGETGNILLKKTAGVEKTCYYSVHIAASCDARDDFFWGEISLRIKFLRCVACVKPVGVEISKLFRFFWGSRKLEDWDHGLHIPCQEFRTKMCVFQSLKNSMSMLRVSNYRNRKIIHQRVYACVAFQPPNKSPFLIGYMTCKLGAASSVQFQSIQKLYGPPSFLCNFGSHGKSLDSTFTSLEIDMFPRGDWV